MSIDLKNIEALLTEKYVMVQKHPNADLFIYNYTQLAQYERKWNDTTLHCRGLILNEKGEIVARPFKKFFNLEEHPPQDIPLEGFEVYEKLDGSLGILYWLDDKPYIATRGSFMSEQAQKANEILYNKYVDAIPFLKKDRTYLFEIIYPENRIVVDYGSTEELILLAIIDNETGIDLSLENIGFPLVQMFDGVQDIKQLRGLEKDNKEGFVVKFTNGFRVKVKFEEYVRLHRILTGVSNKLIWEFLKENKPLDLLLERVPDEFFDWVKTTKANLEKAYQKIEAEAKKEFKILGDKKETALYFQTCKYPSILFAMLNHRNYAKIIWKMLKPTYEKPFRMELEN